MKTKMQNKTIFDLEQEIFHCWNLADDIKMLSASVDEGLLDPSELPKLLEGLSNFYQLKFSKLFSTFEHFLSERRNTQK